MPGKIIFERLWDTLVKTGLKTIDDEHRVLIDVIIELLEDFNNNNNKDSLNMRNAFTKLIQFMSQHFDTEETLMSKFNYYRYIEHKQQHWEFIKGVLNLSFDYLEKKPNIKELTIVLLEKWLIEHVVDEDSKFIECFKNNGVV
jgi:hemerythrin